MNWIKTIKGKGIIEKSIEHLIDVSKKSITDAYDLDKRIYEIVKFVNKNILNRISKKLKTNYEKSYCSWFRFWRYCICLSLRAIGYDVEVFEKSNRR